MQKNTTLSTILNKIRANINDPLVISFIFVVFPLLYVTFNHLAHFIVKNASRE
jgi:hypothetical protein